MDFIKTHFGLFLASLLVGSLAYFGSDRFSKYLQFENRIEKSMSAKIVLALLALTFVVWGYFSKPVFYFPNNEGVIGDNYAMIEKALEKKNFLKNHHPAFPWVAEQTIKGLEKTGILRTADPFYYEKAFSAGSLPTRLGMPLAIFLIALLLYWRRQLFWPAWLAFFLIGTSYGAWIWGLQTNALGLAIIMQAITFFLILAWRRKRSAALLMAAGVANSLCVYVHNSLVFFSAGVFISFLIMAFASSDRPRKKLIDVGLFTLANGIMGYLYYKLQTNINQESDLVRLIHIMGNTNYPGAALGGPLKNFPGSLAGNISTGIMNVTNIWKPRNLFDSTLIFFQMSAMTAVFISLIARWKITLRKLKEPETLLFVITSLTVLCCFMLTLAGTHYYVVAFIPNLMLLLFLVFQKTGMTDNSEGEWKTHLFLLVFIVSSFLYSGFSSWNVFRGGNPRDLPYYNECTDIANTLAPGQTAKYYRKMAFVYEIENVRSYYRHKFGHIVWDNDPGTWGTADELSKRLFSHLNSGQTQQLYIGKQAHDFIDNSNTPRRFETVPVAPDIWHVRL